jgi:transcription initiation factor TFIIIB Brf1 subunit/transcription initiation factor TFIIB
MFRTYKDMIETFKDLELNHLVIEAFKVYKKIYEKKLYRGRNRKGIKAGCLLYIIRKNDNPAINTISPKKIADVCGLKKNTVLTGFKKVNELLHRYNLGATNTSPTNTKNYIAKYCANLGIKEDNQKSAQDLMNGLQVLGTISNNTDKTQITGCIYTVVCMNNIDNIDKDAIADVCGISDVTLQKCYNKILSVVDQILNLDEKQKNNLGIN